MAAAAPANDDFANAEALGPALPVSVTRTNVEATPETDDPSPGILGEKGHSVWFSWEASVDGWVTVGTCGSDFATVLGVYSGPSIEALTEEAVGSYRGPTPSCSGEQATFAATSGVTYHVFVDGDPFFLPPASPPSGEGTIELQIALTPTPTNDDFDDAIELGLFGGSDSVYRAPLPGFNWNATKETGEPEHDGDPGGASVWYRWTAPRSGEVRVSLDCQGFEPLLGVYTGDSLGSLTSVGPEMLCGVLFFDANAGTTYRIAVDGDSAGETQPPSVGGFEVAVWFFGQPEESEPPEPAAEPSPSQASPPADVVAPQTFIRGRRLIHRKRLAVFRLRASEPVRAYRCRLDRRRRWSLCRARTVLRRLRPGRHVLRVVAIDRSGNRDRSPAVARFCIRTCKQPTRRPHRPRRRT